MQLNKTREILFFLLYKKVNFGIIKMMIISHQIESKYIHFKYIGELNE